MSHCLLLQEKGEKWVKFAQYLTQHLDFVLISDKEAWRREWEQNDFSYLSILGGSIQGFQAGRFKFFSDFRFADPNHDGIPEVIVSRYINPKFHDNSTNNKNVGFFSSGTPKPIYIQPLQERAYQINVATDHVSVLELLNTSDVIIHFNGHGDESSWRTNTETGCKPLLKAEDLNNIYLNNNPFVFSAVCITASPKSLMLHNFLNAGASAYLGFTGPLFGVPKAKEHPGLKMDKIIFKNLGISKNVGTLLLDSQIEFIEKEHIEDDLINIHENTGLGGKKWKSVLTLLEFILFGNSLKNL